MGQLSGVAGDDGLVGLVVILCGRNLVEDGDHEDCSLAHTGLRLAEDVVALKGQGNGLHLHLAGMLEAAFPDGPLELILEEKLVPAGQVSALVLLILHLLGLLLIGALILRHNISHPSLQTIISIIQLEQSPILIALKKSAFRGQSLRT